MQLQFKRSEELDRSNKLKLIRQNAPERSAEMSLDDEFNQSEQKNICSHCVGEAFLTREIKAKGERGKCSYCGKAAKCYSVAVCRQIEMVFSQHYTRTSDQCWERDGEEVIYAIMNAAGIPNRPPGTFPEILDEKFSDFDAAAMGEETEFSLNPFTREKGVNSSRWQDEWDEFNTHLRRKLAFFSRSGAELLASVFVALRP